MTEFVSVDEADVTKAIVSEYLKELEDMTDTDAVVEGSGPSGAVAARKLAEKGHKVLIIERNIKPGGGMYLGGMLMNKLVVEAPADRICREVGVKSLKEYKPGLFVGDAHEVATKLIAAAFDAGAHMLNAVQVEDIIYRDTGICGVVINWHMVSSYPNWVTCTDPLALKTKVVIDATGHAAEVAKLAGKRFGFEVKGHEGAMWVDEAEKATLNATQEIYPGLIVCGMAANGVYMLPRMGPVFGAMFMSGEKAAELAHQRILELKKAQDMTTKPLEFIAQKR